MLLPNSENHSPMLLPSSEKKPPTLEASSLILLGIETTAFQILARILEEEDPPLSLSSLVSPPLTVPLEPLPPVPDWLPEKVCHLD